MAQEAGLAAIGVGEAYVLVPGSGSDTSAARRFRVIDTTPRQGCAGDVCGQQSDRDQAGPTFLSSCSIDYSPAAAGNPVLPGENRSPAAEVKDARCEFVHGRDLRSAYRAMRDEFAGLYVGFANYERLFREVAGDLYRLLQKICPDEHISDGRDGVAATPESACATTTLVTLVVATVRLGNPPGGSASPKLCRLRRCRCGPTIGTVSISRDTCVAAPSY